MTGRAREEGAAEEGGGGEEEEGEANKTNRKRKKKKKESVCVREGLERSVWFGTERDRTAFPFRMLQEHKLNAPHHSFISLVMSLVVQILE